MMKIRRILPPLNLFVLCIAGMTLLRFFYPVAVIFPFPYNYLGLLPLLAGIFVAVKGVRHILAARTNLAPFREADTLITDGIYRHTRNPIYLGLALALVGVWVLHRSVAGALGVMVFVVIADLWYIRYEEQMLREKFGHAYEDYRRRTRRWI